MLNVLLQAERRFGPWAMGVSCWDPHSWNPSSDHPLGRACDFVVGEIGHRPDADARERGSTLASWAVANARRLGISYVIWQGETWSAAREREGWRPYGGGGIYDPRSLTGGHFDHVHISVADLAT